MSIFVVHASRRVPFAVGRALRIVCAVVIGVLFTSAVGAEPPRATYIFPAGAQRGTKPRVRVGGLFLHDGAALELFGPQIALQGKLRGTETIWFDNPLARIPAGEGGDDRARDYLIDLDIPAHSEVGPRHWRLWTSQGATASKAFVIGDLPEIVEEEISGHPIASDVTPAVTINGRIFPSEDVDVWRFRARRGETWLLSICAAEIGSPLRARVQLFDPEGARLEIAHGLADRDPQLTFTAPKDGVYEVRIDDVRLAHTVADGGFHRPAPQSYVYRLTIAQQWHVEGVYPLGGRRGSAISLRLLGEDIPAAPLSVKLPDAPGETWTSRFKVDGHPTNPVTLEMSDIEEFLEHEPNDDPQRAEAVVWPAVINGRIGRPGDIDTFRLRLRKGNSCDFDLKATRLLSPLDAVLSVCDSRGRELARDESLVEGQNDPSLRFSAPADGDYLVKVSGRLASRGGPGHAYRLHITAAESDFQLSLPRDAVTALRGAAPEESPRRPRRMRRREDREAPVSARLPVQISAPLPVPVRLLVDGLPHGVTVKGTEIPAGSQQTELVFSVDDTVPIQSVRLTIRGTAELEGHTVTRTAVYQRRWGEPPIDDVRLAVALPTPFKIRGATDYSQSPRGTVFRWNYLIDRKGYDGPITVRLSDHQPRQLQGMTGPTITVPAGVNYFTYPAQLAPWMMTGRASRTAVMGFATVTDKDGSRHVVHDSAEDARSQIYLLVTAGPFSIEPQEPTIAARAGTVSPVRVHVSRESSFRSAVRIELHTPAHIHGVAADPVVIPAGSSEGELRLHFTAPLGPFNMPLTLRGVSLDTPDPLEAETQLELVETR